MPKGILTQFIVALHPFIWNQTVVWRSGVVLENEGARAEVIEYYNKREIRIRVSKTRKKELMAIVMYELDKIHAKYKRLKFHKLIPCNCPDCKNAKEPYFYRYETLQKFIDDRQSQIQCLQSYEMVNVLSLIGDIYISFITNRNLVDATFNKIEMSQIHPQMKELLKHLVQSVLTLIKGAREEVPRRSLLILKILSMRLRDWRRIKIGFLLILTISYRRWRKSAMGMIKLAKHQH